MGAALAWSSSATDLDRADAVSASKIKQAGGVAAADSVAIGVGESGCRVEARDRIVDAHIEREIGAEHHLARPGAPDEIGKLLGVEHQCVEPKALEIFARRLAAGLRLGPYAPSVVEPADVEGKISAAVSAADLEPWMAVEHTAENQFRQRDGRVCRIANHVGEIVGRDSCTEGASGR